MLLLLLRRMTALSCIAARRLSPLAALIAVLALPPCHAADLQRNVLMLNTSSRPLPALTIVDQTFDAVVRAESGLPVAFASEFLDLDGPARDRYYDSLVAFLRSKYSHMKLDAIVAIRGPALDFLLARRDELFPGVPIVYIWLTAQEVAAKALPPDVVGVPIVPAPQKTIELALNLHPNTRRVVVITGTSAFDRALEASLRKAFQPFESRLPIDYWAGLPLAEVIRRARELSPDTVVYMGSMLRDGAGQRLVPQLVVDDLVKASPAPVYGGLGNNREGGLIGGYLPPLEDIARQAGLLTARLLRGEKVETLSPPAAVENRYVLNMQQLERFGFAESAVPSDAILMFRQPTLWAAYRWQIIAVLALLLLQAGLIAALLMQRRTRQRAEAELRETQQRMSLAADATGLGVWTLDLARKEFWASPQHRALLGIGESESYDFDRFLRAVHPADREHVRQTIDGALARGGHYDLQYRVPSAAGRARWINSRGNVELDAAGRPASIRGVTADVTARYEAEREAERHRNELAHVSRVGMLGQLSGSIAHELNQPLTAILTNAQAALRFLKLDAANVGEVREILNDIVADDKRARDVIRRLRALFERGEAKEEPLDINGLIREVLLLLRSDLVSRNVAVATELDPGLPIVDGDRVQLQQLLLNLVLNGCEAMAGVQAVERRLTIGTAPDGAGHIVVTVADRGPGIAPDKLESIFEPFVTSKELGIGLGLAISRNVVDAHGGRLWASNNADRGATFSFTLPVRGAEAAAARPAAKVDDDETAKFAS